jgi:hypothetical protein
MGTNALPPDLQSALERLFALFAAYLAASTNRERRTLQAQIIQLFSTLGAVSDYPVIKQAAATFGRMRQEPATRVARPLTPPVRAQQFVNERLKTLERRYGLVLSNGARQLLRVPVMETAELREEFDEGQTLATLDRIFTTLREEPNTSVEGVYEKRTSIAVIRALWKNFCRIPPFCAEK